MLQILLDYSSADVRLVLRVYFNIILAALAISGDQCCKKRSQLRLLQGQKLDVTQTTGWLRGPSAIYIMYTLRRSPAGWLGLVMLLASAFWLAADLIVTGFVVPIGVVDRCAFNTTSASSYMVSNTNSSTPVGPFTPSNIGRLWDIITTATTNSRRNGGLTGVFHKANTDLAFRADEDDIVLGWQCVISGPDSSYSNVTTPTQVLLDLVSRNLLYGNYSAQMTKYIGGYYLQLGAWSSPFGDWDNELAGLTTDEIIASPILRPWDVKAAIDLSKKSSDARLMRPYHCSLNDTSMNFILGKVQAGQTLAEFVSIMRSNVYGYFTDDVQMPGDPAVEIASTLDLMLMMAAAFNAGRNTPPPPITDLYQGCIKYKSQIPEAVIIVFAAVTGTTVLISLYLLILICLVHASRNSNVDRRKLIGEHTLNGLLGWVMQTVHSTNTDLKPDGLRGWTLAMSIDQQRLELQHESRDGPVNLQQSSSLLYDRFDMPYEPYKAPYVETRRLG